jgi:hypothetical protein
MEEQYTLLVLAVFISVSTSTSTPLFPSAWAVILIATPAPAASPFAVLVWGIFSRGALLVFGVVSDSFPVCVGRALVTVFSLTIV